jgi:hypothetical protein
MVWFDKFIYKKNWTRGGYDGPGRCFKKKMIFSVLTQIQKISKPLPYMYMAAPTPV